jgi:hypothetical protein
MLASKSEERKKGRGETLKLGINWVTHQEVYPKAYSWKTELAA